MSATSAYLSILRRRMCVHVGTSVLTPKLTLPEEPRALVVVANASGDRTYERVNHIVTVAFWAAGFATLEAHLLTREEAIEDAETSAFRFDMDFIARRVAALLASAASVSERSDQEARG